MAIYNKLVNMNGKQLGVYSLDDYKRNMEILCGDEQCAVEFVDGDKTYVLPVIDDVDVDFDKPGVYGKDGKLSFIITPDEDNESEYMPTGDNVLVFSDHQSLQSLSDAKKKLDDSLNKLLESPVDSDNIYKPPLLETDTAEMRAMKECIIAKNIDLDKYKDRFGANYPNDKRKLKDNTITLNMINRICENLDLRLDLKFTDANGGDVPNAMNKIIIANIVPGDGSCTIIDKDEYIEEEDDE